MLVLGHRGEGEADREIGSDEQDERERERRPARRGAHRGERVEAKDDADLGTVFIVGGAALVAGGIAAYKSLELVRLMKKAAHEMTPVLTEGGEHFVTAMSLGTLAESFNAMAERLEERESRLAELDRLKSEFVSSVSHELRTPLTTVRMAADLIFAERDEFDPAGFTEPLQAIFKDIQALATVISSPPRSWTPEKLWRALQRPTASSSSLFFITSSGHPLSSLFRMSILIRRSNLLVPMSDPGQVDNAWRHDADAIRVTRPRELDRRLLRHIEPVVRREVLGRDLLGEVEEYFIEQLEPGDTFVFAGEVLRFEGLRENDAIVTRAHATEPKVPAYEGGKFPLSTYLAERVRNLLADPQDWPRLPDQVSDWLRLQAEFSVVPGPDEVLVETFPRGQRHYLVCYPFEGRLAHQSLGMLLTRRLERARAAPLGFVANEYALAIWGLNDIGAMVRGGRLDLAQLFDEDMLGDDLDAWLASSSLMKRSFRVCAIISGLIERRHPGQEKTGRQMTVSSDLIYDVLRQHEPDHILLKAAFADAATGLIDVGRLGYFLRRIKGRIRHIGLRQVSPLAVPVMLEIGRESVPGEASEVLLRETVEELIAEALSGHAERQA